MPSFPLVDDDCLRRYLRARKHDILKAKKMVLSTLEWRKEIGADDIFETFDFKEKAQFHANYPEGFYCTDRHGRPVYVQQPGNIDCAELWKFTTLERSITYHITQQEKYVRKIAPAACVAAGRVDYQSTVLIDMEGVGVSTLTGEVRTIMGKVMQIDQDYYPVSTLSVPSLTKHACISATESDWNAGCSFDTSSRYTDLLNKFTLRL